MLVTGYVNIENIHFKGKKNPETNKLTLDYAVVEGSTYKQKADGDIKEDKNGNEVVSYFELHVYGKPAKNLKKIVKTDKKDLTGYKLFVKRGELRDKIERLQDEDGREIQKRTGKYINVYASELMSKNSKNPDLKICFNGYVLKGKESAVTEKQFNNDYLVGASLTLSHFYQISKDKSEAVFINVDSIDNVKSEDERLKNKTGVLLQYVKEKAQLNIVGSLKQSKYQDKNDETKEWFSVNLDSFDFVSSGGSNNNREEEDEEISLDDLENKDEFELDLNDEDI